MIRPLLVVLPLAVLAACSSRPRTAPADLSVLRTYGWEAGIDPQPAWNPLTDQVLVRTAGGFAVLQEGGEKITAFLADDKRTTAHPRWIDGTRFVFGPGRNVLRTTDGRIVADTGGLTMITLAGREVGESRRLADYGYRPRPSGDRIVAQVEDKVVMISANGRSEDFDDGFYAEPQVGGRGLCWQETPVFEEDHWTGKPALGRLIIRWKPGVVTFLDHAVEARWTAAGGVVATVLDAAPRAGAPWWAGGSRVVLVAGPKAEPLIIATAARSPAPHPSEPLIAVVGDDGGVWVVAGDGTSRERIADQGDRPQWNGDGTKLLVEELRPAEAGTAERPPLPARTYVRVHVLKNRNAAE